MSTSHGDVSKQAIALLPELERFLTDLGSKDVGAAMGKQADLLSKIRAIKDLQSTANGLPPNQNPANGHVTPPSPTGSHSFSEVIYDDAVTEAGLKTVTSSLVKGHVVKEEEEEEVEYDDVTEYCQGQGQKKAKTQSPTVTTKGPECNADIVAADKAASGAIHAGHLIKKSKSQVKALWTKLTGERRWCVLTKDSLYYYEKNTSKQQLGTIHLTDYQCTPTVSESLKKPEHTFVLTGVNKKTHTFVASSSEDLTAWMESMKKVCLVKKQVTSPTGSEQTSVTHNTSVDEEFEEEENIYDEMPADAPPVSTQVSKVKATTLTSDIGRVERFRECNGGTSPAAAGNKVMVNEDDDVTCEEQIYDDAISPASPSSSVAVKSPSSLPYASPPLPARGPAGVKVTEDDPAYPPLPPRRVGVADEEAWPTDPASCLFMVKCEWREAQGAELVCRRGQLVQLVSKQHESEGWWTMTDGHVTGLVPCTYVTAAFTSAL